MRLTLLALCLVGTVFGGPAAADLIELTSGGTDRPFPPSAILTAAGAQFSMDVGLDAVSGIFTPGIPYAPGATIVVHAANLGNDLRGFFTYQGQTFQLGTMSGPDGFVDLLSVPFVVPPIGAGAPITLHVPFTLTGGISPGPNVSGLPGLVLHGTGDMAFTFSAPAGSIFGPQWFGGSAVWVVTTPEPSAIVLVSTVLSGLGVCAWRRLRLGRGDS